MAVTIQIRNVPEALHRRLKALAALTGTSLSDDLRDEVRRVAERSTIEELRARLERRQAARPAVPPARMVRAERGRR
jgi:plasmid stability protein